MELKYLIWPKIFRDISLHFTISDLQDYNENNKNALNILWLLAIVLLKYRGKQNLNGIGRIVLKSKNNEYYNEDLK